MVSNFGPGLKLGRKNHIFWSEIGKGFPVQSIMYTPIQFLRSSIPGLACGPIHRVSILGVGTTVFY